MAPVGTDTYDAFETIDMYHKHRYGEHAVAMSAHILNTSNEIINNLDEQREHLIGIQSKNTQIANHVSSANSYLFRMTMREKSILLMKIMAVISGIAIICILSYYVYKKNNK